MEPIYEETIGDYVIRIFPDYYPASPDEEWGTFGNMRSWDDLCIGEYTRRAPGDSPTDLDSDCADVIWIHADRYGLWESSPEDANGAIYCTHADITRELVKNGTQRSNFVAREILASELEKWRMYVEGEVYGFEITTGSFIDSCWGFYGFDHCLSESRNALPTKSDVTPSTNS
jgi:hypothetical protein